MGRLSPAACRMKGNSFNHDIECSLTGSCVSRGGRRKRQAEGVDYKEIYNKVMANLSSKFSGDELTQTQKTEATQIITNTQVTEDAMFNCKY